MDHLFDVDTSVLEVWMDHEVLPHSIVHYLQCSDLICIVLHIDECVRGIVVQLNSVLSVLKGSRNSVLELWRSNRLDIVAHACLWILDITIFSALCSASIKAELYHNVEILVVRALAEVAV